MKQLNEKVAIVTGACQGIGKGIAPVIAFLAGPDSCYFSGQSVVVDGANSIMP